MKTVRGWLTHAFNEMRLEEVPYPALKPGWAIVKTKGDQASATEAQRFCGERAHSWDKVKKALSKGLQQGFGRESCAEIVDVDEKNQCGVRAGGRVGATHPHIGTIGREFPGCFSEYAAVTPRALAEGR